MPFRSEAQRRLLWATKPELAHRWAHEPDTATEKKRDLPYHAEKKALWAGFVGEMAKLSGLPQEEPAPRVRVPGLKQPRIATPRLNPELNAGGPSNPFRGNWQKLGASLDPHQQLALGLGVLGAGAYTLKRTGDQLVNPRPSGVGAGAGARTVQRVLLPGTSRAQAAPQIYGSY